MFVFSVFSILDQTQQFQERYAFKNHIFTRLGEDLWKFILCAYVIIYLHTYTKVYYLV